METKSCFVCGLPKSVDLFSLDKSRRDGRQPRCKECYAAYRMANRDKINAQKKTYAEANKTAIAEKDRAYYKSHRDKIRARQAEYVKHNRDAVKAKKKAWRTLNMVRVKSINDAWRAGNADHIRDRCRAYRISRPDVIAQMRRNRRARHKMAEGRHTRRDIESILMLQRYRCANPLCASNLRSGFHVDHILPLALGGSNDRFNLQALCPTCNRRKHAKHPLDFARENGLLI